MGRASAPQRDVRISFAERTTRSPLCAIRTACATRTVPAYPPHNLPVLHRQDKTMPPSTSRCVHTGLAGKAARHTTPSTPCYITVKAAHSKHLQASMSVISRSSIYQTQRSQHTAMHTNTITYTVSHTSPCSAHSRQGSGGQVYANSNRCASWYSCQPEVNHVPEPQCSQCPTWSQPPH
jgi:hypothetical protein